MNIALFYRYYLKRLFKSWFFWVYSILLLVIVFGLPYFVYKSGEGKYICEHFSINNYKDYLKCISGIKTFSVIKHGHELNSRNYGNSEIGIFASVFKNFALSSGKSYSDILTTVWKLTCFGLTGFLITWCR